MVEWAGIVSLAISILILAGYAWNAGRAYQRMATMEAEVAALRGWKHQLSNDQARPQLLELKLEMMSVAVTDLKNEVHELRSGVMENSAKMMAALQAWLEARPHI